jgi:hypothetical protein
MGAKTRQNKVGKTTRRRKNAAAANNTGGGSGSIPSPLSSPERQNMGFDVFGGSPISADDLTSLLSPNGMMIGSNVFGGPVYGGDMKGVGGAGAGAGEGGDGRGGGTGVRRRNGYRGSGGHLLPRTGSRGELELPGGGFIDDIDQLLAYAEDKDMARGGSSIGPLAETLDKVNLDDDLVSFDLAPRAHSNSGSAVSVGNMMAPGQAKRKGRRPKLEQMPPDTFNIQSMEPVMSPFAWANNPDAPSSITPRDSLGEPKTSFGDLLTPNGTNLNLFSPSGMDFAEDYDDL